MTARFEELRLPCPGLSELIEYFVLAGRLAKHVSPETESHGPQAKFINASEDVVFALEDRELGELQKDIFAISWVMQSVALIHPLQKVRRLSTFVLLNDLNRAYDKFEPAVIENLLSYPFWERLQHICPLLGDGGSTSSRYGALHEALRELGALHLPKLQLPTVEPRESIQLQLTERDLTTANWHFPRPADLNSLQSLIKANTFEKSSPTWFETLIILVALATGRDTNQALCIQIRGESCPSHTIVRHQHLAFRNSKYRDDFFGRTVNAEWRIPIGKRGSLMLPLPNYISAPLQRLIPNDQEGRLIDFLPPTSLSWETRCDNLIAKIFCCSPRQANLKVRDFLIRETYEISGNRGFIQWLWAGRHSNNKKTQRSEQVSLSAYLDPKGEATEWVYKNALHKLIGEIPDTYNQFRKIVLASPAEKEAATFLRSKVVTTTQSNDLIAKHNAFALYSLCLLIAATGHRKSNTPFFFAFDLHIEDRLAFIADKCIVGSEARFVPLADSVLKQIEAYRQHLQVLAVQLKGANHTVVRHIASLFKAGGHHHKSQSVSAPTSQEFGLFFQIRPDGSIETIRTGQLDDQFKSAGLKSRIGLLRKAIATYLWDNTGNGHLVAALLGHANDYHPFGPASAWSIDDWSQKITPIIESYLITREWEVLESPLGKFKRTSQLSAFSVASLQTTSHSYEGRIKERLSAHMRAKRAIKTALTDEFLEDNNYHITDELLLTIRTQINELLNGDTPARKAAPAQLEIALWILKQRGNAVESPVKYIPYRADSPIKISFSRYLSKANDFRKCWIQLVGTPIGGKLDATERLAQLAICLVVFDGVLDPKRIKASIHSTASGTGISEYGDTISIRANVETREHQFDALTIPGDLSTAFVLGLEADLQELGSSHQLSAELVFERINGILRKIYGRTANVSLELLCDIFKPWWLIRLPGAIYSIAIGQHNGPCPNPPSEISLFADREPDPTPLGSGLETFASRATAVKAACKAANSEFKLLLSSAAGSLEQGTAHNRRQRRQLAKQLEAPTSSKVAYWCEKQPIVAYLITFTRALMHGGSKKKKSISFRSIRTYLSWISSKLIKAAWDQDISELDYQELNAVYKVVEDACRGKRTNWKLVIELFHQHVRETVGAVDIPRLRSRDNQWKKRCRSSLFTSQAIDHAVITLMNANSDSGELASASLTMLATGLGYGTRRSESAGLKATDFDICRPDNLAIRANVIRDLKSFAGRRVISAPLLESKELRESITHTANRSKSTSGREPYLLVSYQKDQKVQKIQPIVKAVVEALRSASSNKYAVYHDLRRTFATKLIMAGIPLRSDHSGLKRARDRLLGNSPPTPNEIHCIVNSTPKSPYLFDATGRVLGHADESTLLNVYFLGSPIILADRAIVVNRGITIDDGRLGNILGKDRTTVLKMKQRLKYEFREAGNDVLIKHYIPKYFAQTSKIRSPEIAPLITSREDKAGKVSPWPWFDQVLCTRKDRSLSLTEMKVTALGFRIPDDEATSFVDNYEQMLIDTGFSDFEPDNSSLLNGPPLRSEGVLRGAKERQSAIYRISKMAFNDKDFRKLLAGQISSWQRYVDPRDPWLVCRRLEDFEATLSFLTRIGVREGQLRCETVTTLAVPLLQTVSKRFPNVIVHGVRRFSRNPSNTKANEIGINIGQLLGSTIPDNRDFHRMMALIACLLPLTANL